MAAATKLKVSGCTHNAVQGSKSPAGNKTNLGDSVTEQMAVS